MRCKPFAGIALSAAVWVLTCGFPRAGELDPAALTYKLPSQIEWKAPFGPAAGIETAVLVGDPSKPGFYAVMVKWAPGNHFSRPHFHPHDRFITVLKGTGGSAPARNSIPTARLRCRRGVSWCTTRAGYISTAPRTRKRSY